MRNLFLTLLCKVLTWKQIDFIDKCLKTFGLFIYILTGCDMDHHQHHHQQQRQDDAVPAIDGGENRNNDNNDGNAQEEAQQHLGDVEDEIIPMDEDMSDDSDEDWDDMQDEDDDDDDDDDNNDDDYELGLGDDGVNDPADVPPFNHLFHAIYNVSDDSDDDYFDDRDNFRVRAIPRRTVRRFFGRGNIDRLAKWTEPKEPEPYAFQPLKLIKVDFKSRSMPDDKTGHPLARSGHRIIASDSNLYSLGGYNPRTVNSVAHRGQCLLFQELWRYNFATNRWYLMLDGKKSANMPEELASNALVIHNNVLISHGGTGYPFGESCSNDCYVYTTGEETIVTHLPVSGDLPTAQYGPGIVIHGEYLYTIGGTTGFDYSCDVYRLNLHTKVWEIVYICRPEMREDPQGRYRHEVVYDGQHIFILGGGTSHNVYDLQRLPAFNLTTNKWEYFDTLPDRSVTCTDVNIQHDNVNDDLDGFPKPRKCFSCVQHTTSNGDVEAFITGGMQADLVTYFADIWRLNLRTKQWTCIRTATLPKPLYFHSAAHSANGCMHIFGGIEYNTTEMRRRNHLYKMWMCIPKLSEMCWEAMTHYNRDLDQHGRIKLLASGIPEKYVQRLPPPQKRDIVKEEKIQSNLRQLANLIRLRMLARRQRLFSE